MKVLLINPQKYKSYRPSAVPLGLISIATYLNANGHEAIVHERSLSNEKIKRIIERVKPDIIGISVITYCAIKDSEKISSQAKKLGIPVVWGGAMATAIPREILESGAADYVSLGEGEETWLEIAEAYDRHISFDNIKGLALLKDGKFFATEKRESMDLSVIPKLDWSLIEPEKFFQKGFGCRKQIYIYLSKGCIGNCSFCYNKQFNNCKRRERPMEYVIEEMVYLTEKYGADGFNFTDDLMFANKKQLREFCNRLIESGIKTTWTGCLRIDTSDDPDDFKLMYESGCRNLIFGVESGSPKIQRVLNKRISEDKTEKVVSMCADAGIVPLLTFMIGLPGETDEDAKKSVLFSQKLEKAFCCFQFYTPIPGTKMYDDMVKDGKYKPLKNLKQYSKVTFGESIVKNVSDIKTKDIYAICRYSKLREFTYRDENSPDEQMIKVISNIIKSMTGRGLGYFICSGINNAKKLFELLSFFLHPKTRKKYNLYFNIKK